MGSAPFSPVASAARRISAAWRSASSPGKTSTLVFPLCVTRSFSYAATTTFRFCSREAATDASSVLSGGTGGASVPDSGDTVIFDSAKNNSAILDASYAGSVGAVDVRSGYTQTITQRRALTVAGALSLASGAKWNYTAGTAATLDVGGDMTVNGTLECQYTANTALPANSQRNAGYSLAGEVLFFGAC